MIADFMDQFEKLDFAIAKLKRKPIKIQKKGNLEKRKKEEMICSLASFTQFSYKP